jgi:hypothetical protein
MRKSTLAIRFFGSFAIGILLLIANPVGAQVVRYGNVADLGGSSDHLADYLLGSEINVPQQITLTGAGILFRTSGYNAEVGIYADSSGVPGALLGDTGPFAVASTGYVETPVLDPVVLPAGNYWFEAVYDNVASVGISFDDPSAQVDYVSLDFGSPLPNPFPAPDVYDGQAFNYYLVGTTVPEPASLGLFGLGALGLLARHRD